MPPNNSLSQTGSKALKCYDFNATNTTDRPLTDIHIPLGDKQKTDIPPHGPEGWEGRHDGDGITFETPPRIPPATSGGTRPRPMPPKPIKPGDRLKGFTFYLDGAAQAEGMFFTFEDDGPTVEGSVEQGGTIIQPSESGTIHPTGMIYCFAVTITAPADQPIYIVQIKTNKPIIHGVTDPEEGWSTNSSNDSDGGTFTGFSIGDRQPIPPGQSRVFRICSKHKKLDIDWTVFDGSWGLVDEGEGTLRFS